MVSTLMPKATAVWLVANTTLTFEQIADFCGLHKLEVQAIADGDVAMSIVGLDPVFNGQLSAEEIKRCEADEKAKLKMLKSTIQLPTIKTKGAKYTPISKRGDKPDAISYLIKSFPELSDAQIVKLIGTTKATIKSIRERTHWNSANIKPQNPILLGLCKQSDLDSAVTKAQKKSKKFAKAEAPGAETEFPIIEEN